MRRARASRSALALLVLLSLLVTLPLSAWAVETATVPGAVDPFADVTPRALAPAERAADELSAVVLDVALDPEERTIGGEMRVTWRNPASVPLAEVWFRLFPNAGYYGEGELTIAEATVDGQTVITELAIDDTALMVPLPDPVGPGETAEIELDFTATVPADSTGSYGIFNHDTADGSWILADWHPLLAVWEEGDGWALPPVTAFGDPTYAPSAFYDVRLAAPDDLAVAAAGVMAEAWEEDGVITHRFIAGPSRDFVIIANDDHAPLSRDVAQTRVTLWTTPDLDSAIAETTLDAASDALRVYNEWFGPYPGREIDLVQIDASGALGIAWAGVIFLDGPSLLAGYGERAPNGLTAVVAHEMSHLWWGILVGGDSNAHPFIQEGLSTVSSILFVEEALGAEAARGELNAWVIRPSLRLLDAGDAIVDLPNAEGENQSIRSAAMYGKGALGFLAIREEIGAEAFEAALNDVATRYRWGEMTPDDLLAAFERAADRDLDTLWSHWFDEAAMTRAEIDTIAGMFG
jgi:hypothetical protein